MSHKKKVLIQTSFIESEIGNNELRILSENLKIFEKIFGEWTSEIIPEYRGEVSILFCGDDRIKSLNAKYRKKNRATDVLSFPLLDLRKGENWQSMFNDEPLGDIVINVMQAKQQCSLYRNNFINEIVRLLCHGFVHLLGFDHELGRESEKKMEELEDSLLSGARKIFDKKN